jgi:hypothetical protein
MRASTRFASACAALLLTACTEGSPTDTIRDEPAFAVNGSGRLNVYNGGVDRAVPAKPCVGDPRRRQFDFWLGEWDAGPAATQTPTTRSEITSILDGCVIAEFWAGGLGRSINAFDPDNGQWHQTWVATAPTGHIRMSGGLDGDDMVLRGLATQPNGVEWRNVYRWTLQGTDQLVQAFELVIGLGETILFQTAGAIRYTRPPTVPVPPAPSAGGCTALGPAHVSRQLDFWLGRWRVATGSGRSLGTAEVTSDLLGCLTEERYTTSKGYRSISFAYYDSLESKWYRTIIDSEGERLELSGGFNGEAIVMTGMEPGPGGKFVHVRLTILPVREDEIHQIWQSSRDGTEWRREFTLVYERI